MLVNTNTKDEHLMSEQIYAVPDAEQAGAIVYWRLSGRINAYALAGAWQEAGLADALLPDTPTPDAALRRAVYAQKSRNTLVRKLPNSKGWAIVDERVDDEGKLKYEVSIRVYLNKIGHVVCESPDSQSERVIAICEQVKETFDMHLDEYSATDVSAWLVQFAATCGAVSLRERGGIYFVPRDTLPYWRKAYKTITSVSDHGCYEIPALKSDEAVDAILDAVIREAQSATDAMQEEMQEGNLQGRALVNREERCNAMLAKLSQYETLLGKSMGAITTRVDDLKADIALAALAFEEGL